jgi:hypothetical protein
MQVIVAPKETVSPSKPKLYVLRFYIKRCIYKHIIYNELGERLLPVEPFGVGFVSSIII